ncbi:TonB-dependent receptor [Marinifilum sp. N1E240]|uniref:TonB-dependent receptor domain-containing protein n=1 Tax=Marinifilum sp. N1E240 TaxID=2608082 RepID=UPI00128D37E5|nr:TonB-dependent receptor [Marinifilum sp. N1E240]MPQ48778.1 TonB-dependent receptor [Marinifilum sp. N1E240]
MKNILSICFLLLGFQIYAQKTIQILDQDTKEPIAFAHYLYQNQKGSSSATGEINIVYNEGDNLQISHVNYGKIIIKSTQLKDALESGKLYLTQAYISLMPTTVIARKTGKAESDVMKVNSSDKLSHDAGDFLSQTALIGGIRKSGSYGFDPVLRGFKYNQINIIMDDGLGATAACPNRMDPPISQIPLNMVDKVEIMKGPHSLRYGNSFGGSIHFKSSQKSFSDKTQAFGRATTNYESNGKIFRTEALAGVKGKFYNFGIFGAYSEGSDYEDGNGDKVTSSFNRRNIGLSGVLKLSSNQSLKISANSNYAEDVDFPALNMDLREDDTKLISLGHKITFNNSALASISTATNASFVDHVMDNLTKNLNPRKVNAITEAETKNYAFRSEAAFQFKESSLFAGVDYKSEEADGTRSREMLMGPMAGNTIYDNIWQDSKISNIGVFGEYHFSSGNTYFIASTRIDNNSAESKSKANEFILANSGDPSDDLNLSLSIGATHDISDKVRMGIWFGRAARSGSLTERFINYLPVDVDPYERIGNTDLNPEINYQIDYNFTWQSKSFNLDINVFASMLRDYISAEIRNDLSPKMSSAPGVKQYDNIDKAVMRGFEISFNQTINSQFYHRINLAYTYGKNKDENQALPEIPPLDIRYAFGAHFCKNKFHPEINFRHALKQSRIAKSYGETETPDFSIVDLNASYFISDSFHLTGGVRNIFDEAYYEHLSRSVKGSDEAIYAPGRSLYITLGLNL